MIKLGRSNGLLLFGSRTSKKTHPPSLSSSSLLLSSTLTNIMNLASTIIKLLIIVNQLMLIEQNVLAAVAQSSSSSLNHYHMQYNSSGHRSSFRSSSSSNHHNKPFYSQQQQQQQPTQHSPFNTAYLPTIDGHHQPIPETVITGSGSSTATFSSFGSCTAPEVMVNGSPSPDIAGTVSGGELGSIEEIQFVGVVAPSVGNGQQSATTVNNDGDQQPKPIIKQKRVCKIKCLNGVWIGPLCAFQNADEYEPVLRPCRVPNIANGTVVLVNGPKDKNYQKSTNYYHSDDDNKSTQPKELPHGSIIKVKCKEIGMYKLSTSSSVDQLQCIDGLWDQAPMPSCQPTTLHMNFSLSSPPSILYTLLDGTLGINDYDDERQQQIVILPGAILHLDCVFQEQFGQPQWSVIDIPQSSTSSLIDDPASSSSSSSLDDSDLATDPPSHKVYDYTEQQLRRNHHNNFNNEFGHGHHHSNVNSHQQNQYQQQQTQQQHGSSYYNRRYHRKHHRFNKTPSNHQQQQQQQQQHFGHDQVRTHTTGWAILTDKQSWKYRLAIYYATEMDSGRYTCTTPNGLTNHVDILVKDVQCPSLDQLPEEQQDHNRLAYKIGSDDDSSSYRMHDRIRFSCLDGFRLRSNGPSEVKCLPNGQWSHPFPTCQEISCPDYGSNNFDQNLDPNLFVTYEKYPSDEQQQQNYHHQMDGHNSMVDHSSTMMMGVNDAIDSHYSYHTMANGQQEQQALRFRCPLGYRLIGADLVICTGRNQWSEPFPSCQQITCPEPDLPANGQIIKWATNGRYLVGDYVQYGCRKGFILIGQDIATCLHNEQWSSPTPICKQVCSYPAKLLNGYYEPVRFHYEIGESVTIRCDHGFRLAKEFDDGQPPSSNTMLCGTDGLWIGQAVKCKRLSTNKQQSNNNQNSKNAL